MDSAAIARALEEAKGYLREGQAKQACDILKQFEWDGRNDPQFLTALGAAYCLSGHGADGIGPLEQALNLAPSPMAHFNLGQCHQAVGDIDAARDCYSRAISLDPTYGAALRALQALKGFGHDPYAVQERKPASEEDSDDSEETRFFGGPPPIGGPPVG